MFDRNGSANPMIMYPGSVDVRKGLTKFEECAKDFTAVWIVALASRANAYDQGQLDAVVQDATLYGMKQAEEFCKQMEKREK